MNLEKILNQVKLDLLMPQIGILHTKKIIEDERSKSMKILYVSQIINRVTENGFQSVLTKVPLCRITVLYKGFPLTCR